MTNYFFNSPRNLPEDGGDEGNNTINLMKAAAAFAGLLVVIYVLRALFGH